MTTATIVDAAERQLVVFDLAGESYGVNIGTVREIIRMQAVTHVPETPEFVEGTDGVAPRLQRKRFGLAVTEQTAESRIVVVDITGHDIGVIVDAVTEVLRVPGSAIESASALVTTEDSYYMDGIAKIGARLLILLDLDRVLQLGDDTANRIAEVAA